VAFAQYQQIWYSKNRVNKLEKRKAWGLHNRVRLNITQAKYRAAKLNATPRWLTKEHWDQINYQYGKCHLLSQQTGVSCHVDHIIPLQGKSVCGLHVPWNLQILIAEDNIKKSNKVNL
jgi:hypothetical protein